MRLNTLMYMNYLKAFVFYFLFLNSGCVAALKCTSPTPQALFNALNTELFSKQQIRPVQNFSTPLIVSLELTVVEILEVDEKSQTLTTILWQVLHWKIDGLSWDENECGTKRVSVLRKNLWVPDIQMTELTDEAKFPETPYVYLNNTGYVFDDRPLRAVISCQLLIYTFPFDVQNCTLTFGSHAHFASDIILIEAVTPQCIFKESKEVMKNGGEWEFIDIHAIPFTLSSHLGNYSEIKYFLILRRRPIRYVVNLLIPSCFLITVDLFSFLLPPQSVDRSSFKMTLILGYTVFLLIVNDLLPVTGETTPLINVFFSISLAMMVASLLETVLITNIQFRSSQCSSVPRWLSVLVLRYLAVVVCLPPKEEQNKVTVFLNPPSRDTAINTVISNISLRELQNDAPTVKPPLAPSAQLEPILEELRRLTRDLTAIRLHVDKHFQESDATEEWQMVGLIIDRLLFGLYVIFITFSFITIMISRSARSRHAPVEYFQSLLEVFVSFTKLWSQYQLLEEGRHLIQILTCQALDTFRKAKMTEMNFTGLIFMCVMLLHGCVAVLKCTSPTPEALFNALNTELFSKQEIRPVQNFSTPLIVSLDITVVEIIGVDEKSQTLTAILWQVLNWKIDGLSWDENECGTKRVSVLRKNLWVPDIQMTEFMGEDKSPETPYVYLNNTGYVLDDRPLRAVISCRLGIYTFPFDVQNCTLTFGSYLHFASDIKSVEGVTNTLDESREVIKTSGEWEFVDLQVAASTLSLDVGSYSEVKYFLILRRRPIRYVVNLLIPSCFLITVDLFSFLLPPQSVDRSSFKMTLILGYTVFLLIMNDLLPVTGETTPLINVFFSISLALMVASLLETVLITNIQFRSSQCSSVPRWLSVLVLRYLAVVVCLPPKKKQNRVTVFLNPLSQDTAMNTVISNISLRELQNDAPTVKPPLAPSAHPESILEELRRLTRDLTAIRLHMDKHFQGSEALEEWQMVGLIIDRLLFGLYVIFITVSFITIMSLWIWNNSFVPLVKNTG
ncbi:uncharacterized protein LOC113139592 [Mastacembelus armatus]|uniref:uncharacterized protein LOC113139592 n=1 Tax=Mastacembelus armatus TaxID=205130 RepID=UPI0014366D97|nr:uncharacterized protein LOC113139592 [Mastacembelus armatus]